MDNPQVLWEFFAQASVGAVFFFILWALVKGRWWAPMWYVEELRKDRDEWKARTFATTDLQEKQVAVSEKLVPQHAARIARMQAELEALQEKIEREGGG